MANNNNTSKTRIRSAVSTKTRVAIAAGAIGVAAAALVGSFVLGKGSVTIVKPTNGSLLRGAQTFDAKVTAPSGYGIASVTFTELPGQRTYNAYFVAGAGVWRADVNTAQLANGPHSVYAQAVFLNKTRSTATATSPLTSPLTYPATSPSTAPIAPRQIVTRSSSVNFSVNNTPILTASPVSVSVNAGAGAGAPTASYVIGGASNVELSKYTFLATENVQIKKLGILIEQAGVETLTLRDGSTIIASNVPVNGANTATFSNFNIAIAAKGSKTITVTAKMRPVGTAGVPTGSSVRTYLLNDPNNVDIRGMQTNKIYTNFANKGNIVGPYRVMKKSVPTVSTVALPSSTLSNGDNTIARASFTANAAGDVSVKGLTLEVKNQSAGATIAPAVASVRVMGTPIPVETVMGQGSCGANSTCMWHIKFANELVIAAGTTKVLEFRVGVTGTISNDSIAARILGDTSYAVPSSLEKNSSFAGYLIHGIPSYFTWSDMSVIAHNDAIGGSADWSNGQYVRVLPTDSQTLTR